MDEAQHFCLRWNNYQSSITSAFESLRDDEDFVDVTLACEGRSIKAHRVVLSACSPYFRDLLKSTPCKHPVILLQDVNYHDLLSLVEFIYHGEVNVQQESLQSFLKTAEVLRVSGLTQQQAEKTYSQLAHIQNLTNAGTRTPLNTHHSSLHDHDSPIYPRSASSPPPPPPTTQLPLAPSQLLKRSMAMFRRERKNSTPSLLGEDSNNTLKRLRGGIGSDNGLPSSNNNSPDIMHHPRSVSPQLTPADFSTIKHNNNNTPPLKDEKRIGTNGTSGNINNNNLTTGNGNANLRENEKGCSLTPSPLTRTNDDVKSEPMELVCSNNNANANDEHSNDSTGEREIRRSNSVDGGKASISSGNDDEIESSLPPHPPPPFLMSPAENKLFPQAFNFPMGNIDPAALAGFNSQLQSAAELSVSPQGSHKISRSAATSPTSSTSSPPSPTTMLTSPNSLAGGNGSMTLANNGIGLNVGVFKFHSSPPRPCSGGSSSGGGSAGGGNCNNGNSNHPGNNNNLVNDTSPTGHMSSGASNMPLRMPPPQSGGINEPQECPYCRRTFSCYYSLKRHFQDKHEQSDTLYVCEFCHRRYRTKNSLTTHKSLQHRGSSGMLKRLLKTSAIKNVLVPHHHHHHHHALSHPRASLFDFTSELGQPPPGIQ